MKAYLPILATVFLLGCSTPNSATHSTQPAVDSAKLSASLAAQDQATKARYDARHPQETLEFFGIAPGMTVVEALPGAGWYTKILLPYLGSEGALIGADYPQEMWPLFGFFPPEAIEKKKTWVADWTKEADGWRSAGDASVSAFKFGSLPSTMNGTADAVLFVRALHNLSRFANEGNYLNDALSDTMRALKPGGIVGVVQHRAPEGAPAESVTGSMGYLDRDNLISVMEKAGFEYVASSEINANPKDIPGAKDIVWRLPPSLATSREDPALREKMMSIGESNRMTLKFRKP